MNDTSGGRSDTRSCWWMVQIPFRLQLLNMSYFKLFYCWLARGSPITSVSCRYFQFRRCNVALIQCGLYTVFVSLVLPTRTPKAMMELSIKDMLRNPCIIHTSDMSTPSELSSASSPLMLQILSTVVLGTCCCHLMCAIFLRHCRWNWSSFWMWWRYRVHPSQPYRRHDNIAAGIL